MLSCGAIEVAYIPLTVCPPSFEMLEIMSLCFLARGPGGYLVHCYCRKFKPYGLNQSGLWLREQACYGKADGEKVNLLNFWQGEGESVEFVSILSITLKKLPPSL